MSNPVTTNYSYFNKRSAVFCYLNMINQIVLDIYLTHVHFYFVELPKWQ